MRADCPANVGQPDISGFCSRELHHEHRFSWKANSWSRARGVGTNAELKVLAK